MKNVLVVDDHPSIRQYAILLLQDEFKDVCFQESDGENDALKKIDKSGADFVVLDLDLKEGDGFSLIQRIREKYPNLPILVNTMYEKGESLNRALRAGANGYISKRDEPLCLLEGISKLQEGLPYFSPSILPLLLQIAQPTDKGGMGVLNPLSDREREVLLLMGDELSKSDIAKWLNISIHTVETHIVRIRRKLNIESGKKLEYFAIKWAHRMKQPPFD